MRKSIHQRIVVKEGCGKMEVINIGISSNDCNLPEVVACIGYFDGLHIGHQALMNKTLALAKAKSLKSAMITFSKDPWIVIKHLPNVPQIMNTSDRNRIIEHYGFDYLIVLDFTYEMANLSFSDFHQSVLNKCHLNTVVCGFDFHYGAGGKGNPKTLQEKSSWDVFVVEAVMDNGVKISSTLIEQCLIDGDIGKANYYLGHAWEVSGRIIHGEAMGRKNGYPTANLALSCVYVIPKHGVYAIDVIIKDKSYLGICNVGHNPTYNYQNNVSMEAYIFDFNRDIYGEHVCFRFKQFIRQEISFNNKEELYQQIEQDIAIAKKII